MFSDNTDCCVVYLVYEYSGKKSSSPVLRYAWYQYTGSLLSWTRLRRFQSDDETLIKHFEIGDY